MKEIRTIYICDRCGEESISSYCIMEVHLPWDLSIAGQEYHFCEKCYKEIHNMMIDENWIGINVAKLGEYLKE